MEFNVKIHCESDVKLVFHEILVKYSERKISQCILPLRDVYLYHHTHIIISDVRMLRMGQERLSNELRIKIRLFPSNFNIRYYFCLEWSSNLICYSCSLIRIWHFFFCLFHSISVETEVIEAVNQSCSVKKVFLEISQNSQENTCARVYFLIKLQATGNRCFPVNFAKFLRTPYLISLFLQNTFQRLLQIRGG